jgi:hypothetical protein
MLTSCIAFGQKQKDKDMQGQVDALTKTNQSLVDSIKLMNLRINSTTTELAKYYGLYTVIKDKVVKMDFNPARMSHIIDSLRSGRDSLISLSSASALLLKDSIKGVNKENDSLRREIQGLQYAFNLLKGSRSPSLTDKKQFTGTWTLLLRKVKIAGQSPKSGIIDITGNVPIKTTNYLETNSPTGITFLDGELAEFTFSNGEKGKCYFVINDIGKSKSYTIDFKGTKFDFKMYFMSTAVGSRVSFEVPGAQGMYYFGEMTR